MVEHDSHLIGIGLSNGTFDEVVQEAQAVVDHFEGTHVEVYDNTSGECVAEIDPLPGKPEGTSKAGYSASYSSAWDAMIARRKERESKGQRTTDD